MEEIIVNQYNKIILSLSLLALLTSLVGCIGSGVKSEALDSSAAPSGFTYSSSTITCTNGTDCTSTVPELQNAGDPIATFSLTSGTLPAGLTLNAQTGEISGIPSALACSTVEVTASNSKGSVSANLTFGVYPDSGTIQNLPGGTLALSTDSLTALQNLGTSAGVTSLQDGKTTFNLTFSAPVSDIFCVQDINVPAGSTVTNVSGDGTTYTFDVNWSVDKGSVTLDRNSSASYKLVSFADDIAPLLNQPLTDGVNTNASACVYCHSGGNYTERHVLIPSLCFDGSSSTTPATCNLASTTTYPKSDYDMGKIDATTLSSWSSIPSITHFGVTQGESTGSKTVDIVTFNPAISTLYTKMGAAGNMPQYSATAPVGNPRRNSVRASTAQAQLVSDWITQGAKNN
jgi:Putative Ig domain